MTHHRPIRTARGRLFGLVVGLAFHLVAAPPSTAARLDVGFGGSGPGNAVEANLRCTPVGSTSGATTGIIEPVEVKIVAPWQGEVALDQRAIWRVEIHAAGHWASSILVSPAQQAQARLTLWPTGRLVGTLLVPPGEAMPAELSARFGRAPAAGQAKDDKAPEGSVDCSIEERRWRCEVPAGALDLRLRAPGFISQYRFAVSVPPAKDTDLGPLNLRRGASVVGFLEVEGGIVVPREAKVSLSAQAVGLPTTPADVERREGLRETAAVSERGFFHFEGIKPGAYVLEAEQKGSAPARLAPVIVEENSETQLREPLVLRPPLTLRANIIPGLGIGGTQWRVELLTGDAASPVVDSLGTARAEVDGRYERRGLAPGTYTLRVTDAQGDALAWHEVLLEHDTEIDIRLDLTEIAGRAWLGKEPLAATLIFGGERGGVRLKMTSDEDGHFRGVLPRSGVWTVSVDARSEGVRRKMKVHVPAAEGSEPAEVEVRLPATHVGGRTVNEGGQPIARAMVKLTEGASGELNLGRSDAEGTFTFVGMSEGDLYLDAYWLGPDGSELQAEPQRISLTEEQPQTDLTVVLRKKVAFEAELTSSAGPVAGALVFGVPRKGGLEYPLAVQPQAASDVEGRFQLQLPADYDSLELIILPPGFALTIRRIAGRTAGLNRIAVDEAGGNLTLRTRDALHLEDRESLRPIVSVAGTVLDPSLLQQWARTNGEVNRAPEFLVVPRLPAGAYMACWLGIQDHVATLAGGVTLSAVLQRRASEGACVAGELPALGELSLALPAPKKVNE